MNRIWLTVCMSILSTLALPAWQNGAGSVVLAEDNGDLLTFTVDGVSTKKADVITSAKEALFSQLLYNGVVGVNSGKKLIEHENQYWLNNFFAGKNAPYNSYITKIEPVGDIQKTGAEFAGKYNIVINYRAFLRTLNANGIVLQETDNRIVFSKSGVGPLKKDVNYTLGPDILNKCSLPSSFAGLYDRVDCDRNQFDGSFEIRCMQGEKPVLLATCNDDDKVVAFAALSSHCRTVEGVSLNNTAAEILAAGGVDKSWKVVDGQMVFWHYCLYLDGVYFLFREGDGAGGKIKSSAKPVGISNVQHAILDLEFLL